MAKKARRPKVANLALYPRLHSQVARILAKLWSPQQIAHRLRLDHPSDPEMRVSHEMIYRSLYVQAQGAHIVPAYGSHATGDAPDPERDG